MIRTIPGCPDQLEYVEISVGLVGFSWPGGGFSWPRVVPAGLGWFQVAWSDFFLLQLAQAM